ncbi:MAG: FAD-dependent oxidoreductase [Solirubrobacterales bacterium]|nr:FAD-dependent oxidoreductase [Solirubrobacterales bacterium]
MPSADYVIVGAGSAGCVLANRLSEDPSVRVLLLEAGGKDRSPNIKIPAAFPKQFHTKLDWGLSTEPQPHCDGRSLFSPRGKGLGGSSSMNAMLYVRGRPLDYDLWEKQGAEGWGWDDVRPYFLKAEHNERGASEHHAVGGPLNVANTRSPRKLTPMFLEAAEASGIPRVADYNGPEQDGASWAQVTQKNGLRFSVADAYLKPVAKRPNLEIVTHAQVLRVELEGNRATGVRYRDKKGKEQVASASREVVLAAGAYGSPQLLMLSGIGPADHLQEVGVNVAHELDGVGDNLHDHPFLVCIFESLLAASLLDAEHPKYLAEFALRRTGPLTSSVGEAFAFVRTKPGLPAPDVQFHFAPAFFSRHGEETHDKHAYTVGPTLVSPKSRGWVKLASADPTAAPRINPNVLSDPDDLAAMVEGVKIARRIAACEPLKSATAREIYPGPEAVSDSEIEADVRRRVELIYHPVGTCRIGVDDRAVVDPELRVRGTRGLRVADASVFPLIPGGNTNAPTIMVAERAADLIRGRVGAGVPA